MSQGGPVWSSHVMHGRYPLPPEGALSECPSRSQNGNQQTPRKFGGMVGGEPKARSTMWPCAFGSARTCLKELIRPALPPLGTAGQGGRYRGYTARCAAGWVGPAWAAWPAVRPVAHSLCAPRASVSARYSARRSGGTQG